jgi:oxygen-dependent protoporphyrinogen oxidase
MKLVVVGGGIAGLATAYYAQKAADEAGLPLDITLAERDPVLGGKIRTDIPDGFVIEGGPDSFITQKPWALQLCRELGLGNRLVGTNDAQRAVYVLRGGKLRKMPDGMLLIVPTRFMPFVTSDLISWPGKIRMGMDLFIPARRDDSDESLADFIRRRLGEEAFHRHRAQVWQRDAWHDRSPQSCRQPRQTAEWFWPGDHGLYDAAKRLARDRWGD